MMHWCIWRARADSMAMAMAMQLQHRDAVAAFAVLLGRQHSTLATEQQYEALNMYSIRSVRRCLP